MLLPDIAPGKRFALPRPPGSADALLLARFAAEAARAPRRRRSRSSPPSPPTRSGSPTRSPSSRRAARRRLPRLGDAALRHLLAAPGPDLRAAGDALADRPRRGRRRPDAGDDGAGPARAAELPRRATPSTFTDQAAARRGGAEGAAHARRLQPRQPGRLARRVRGARRPDRPVPDGLGGAATGSTCSATRSTRSAPSIPTAQRSLYPVPEVRLLPGREFPMDEAARTAFRARWRERFEGDPTKARLYKDIGAGIATAGIEYYLPLFFDADGDRLRLPRRRRDAGAARRGRRGAAALLDRHARAAPLPPARPRSGRSCRPKRCS